jgi:hypothetical protein
MTISLDEIRSERAKTAWLRLCGDLNTILGDDLAAMWAYGGTLASDAPTRTADLDTYVIVRRPPEPPTAEAIEQAEDLVAADSSLEWDTWYITADDAANTAPPRHAFREGRRDTAWAINRAHWLAGRYALLHGQHPQELVPAPTWPELESELDRELEHIERHVAEGDTDPYEATYALLNGSRILRAIKMHDVVISKRAAGPWALDHLPAQWHPALQAAMRSYDGEPDPEDAHLLAGEMAPFVAMVREHVPLTDGRPAESAPRWSAW